MFPKEMVFCVTGLCVYSHDFCIMLQNLGPNLCYVINDSPHEVETSKEEQEWLLEKCLYFASFCLGTPLT
jgi:hypothetical protein